MRILILCYEYPPVGGGGGRVAAQVAAKLAARDHKVRVITAGMRHLPRHERRDTVEILRPESFRRREDTCSVPEMGSYILTSVIPVLRTAWSWRPDVIHAHFAVPSGALAFVARVFAGIPYVLTVHLGDVPGGVPEQTGHLFRLLGPWIGPIWRRARFVTAVSHFVADLATTAYGVNPIVIPNGIEPIGQTELKIHSPRRIVMVGRLSIQKNPLLAIKALSMLKELEWSFEVIGDGPLRGALQALADRYGMGGRVKMRGWLPAAEVRQAMLQADILLMTSLQEGLPMVAIEALQCGLAIVGSRIGGMLDVVEDGGNGFLCDLSAEAFSQKLQALLTDSALLNRMRCASREKGKDFDLEKIVTAYESVLQASNSKNR